MSLSLLRDIPTRHARKIEIASPVCWAAFPYPQCWGGQEMEDEKSRRRGNKRCVVTVMTRKLIWGGGLLIPSVAHAKFLISLREAGLALIPITSAATPKLNVRQLVVGKLPCCWMLAEPWLLRIQRGGGASTLEPWLMNGSEYGALGAGPMPPLIPLWDPQTMLMFLRDITWSF